MEIHVPINVEKFINQEMPKSVRRKVVPAIEHAYDLVDACLEDVSFFNWDIGKKHRGYLDNIAVQYILYQEAKNGGLGNVTAEVLPNSRRSAYHVELKTENVIICINRAGSRNTTARQARYRSLLQMNNQLRWTFGEQQIEEEPGYLELTHNRNDGKVDFVNLGIPDGKGKWYNRIDLSKELHLVERESVNMHNEITKEQLVKFKSFAQGVQNGERNK